MMMPTTDRRPIQTRSANWAKKAAQWLTKKQVSPNTISLLSLVFAALSALAFCLAFTLSSSAGTRGVLFIAALGIQGRLLCNLLDGMVAMEGQKHSPQGPIFNDLPDRIADTLIFIGVGYGLTLFNWASTLAWATAVAALFTAYVRLLGASCGLPQDFRGPMAKPHRMALLTLSALVSIVLPLEKAQFLLFITLGIIALGSLLTTLLRTQNIFKALKT